MREILFRGKTKEGEWIEGSLVRGISNYEYKLAFFIYDLETEIDSRGWIGNYYSEEVIPETVGQFTGLFDNNGIAIFEGDIVKCCGEIRSVIYNAEYAEFEFDRTDPVEYSDSSCLSCDYLTCEIIGNIHDNPELIKRSRSKMTSLKEYFQTPFTDLVYYVVKADTEGMDAIYKDYIIQMVGVYGFNALIENKLLESCGVVNGRQLYVLCERK